MQSMRGEDAPSKKIWHCFEAIRWTFEVPVGKVRASIQACHSTRPEELLVQITRNLQRFFHFKNLLSFRDGKRRGYQRINVMGVLDTLRFARSHTGQTLSESPKQRCKSNKKPWERNMIEMGDGFTWWKEWLQKKCTEGMSRPEPPACE